MAKKRKASGQASGAPKANGNDSKLKINTYEDVADSEDEFHINRDKILLDEGPETKRRRKVQEQEEFLEPSDEEVLDYSQDEEEDDDDDPEDDNEEAMADGKEVDGEFGSEGAEEEEEYDEGWGPSRKDYYNADAIETEQDALDEEKEALRLQKKHLQDMTEADFGFDESEWLDADKDGKAQESEGEEDVVTEVLPQLQITEDMGPAERLNILKTRYPEFEPLSKEFLDLQPLYNELSLAANAAENMQKQRAAKKPSSETSTKTPTAVIKYRTLAAYLAAMTMYFALISSTASANQDGKIIALSPVELREHPVMEELVQCRELWSKVRTLPITDGSVGSPNGNDLEAIEEEDESVSPMDIDAGAQQTNAKMPPPKAKKSKAQRQAEAAQAEAEARRAERMRKTEEDLAALSNLTDKTALRNAVKTKPSKTSKSAVVTVNDDDSDFGDETELTAQELAEKARKKKSLRFYTSQIAQKANKRGAASRDAGGDADIPYRERLKDRQARLQAEAEKRGQRRAGPGDNLGDESDEEDRRQAKEIREAESDEDYYDMVATRGKKRKADKASFAAAQAEAAKQGGMVVEQEEVGPDGKRAITYAIEKNKGLTPFRKKDVRNPRVKKRKKYDEKKKKLSSVRQVYKGGEGRGGYKGELTGIKKALVKSVKL